LAPSISSAVPTPRSHSMRSNSAGSAAISGLFPRSFAIATWGSCS
jgi:hypothetical protein